MLAVPWMTPTHYDTMHLLPFSVELIQLVPLMTLQAACQAHPAIVIRYRGITGSTSVQRLPGYVPLHNEELVMKQQKLRGTSRFPEAITI